MVNFGLNSASILGIFLAVSGAALYFLRSVRPELSRDHDIFFAAVGLLCGFILLFQGWRLDPILQFGQLLLTGSAIFFAVESIRMRGVATEQAKRNTPIVDEDRPVSRVYRYEEQRAELDELDPEEELPNRPRIRGTRDTRSTRTSEYQDEAPRRVRTNDYDDETPRRTRTDDYDDETPRRTRTDDYNDEARSRSSNRSSSVERIGQGDRPRKRRPRPVSRPAEQPEEDEWGSSKRSNDDWDASGGEVSKSPNIGINGSSRSDRNPDVGSRPRKRRPPQNSVPRREPDVEATPTEYVDYKPVDQPDDEPDNSQNFDER